MHKKKNILNESAIVEKKSLQSKLPQQQMLHMATQESHQHHIKPPSMLLNIQHPGILMWSVFRDAQCKWKYIKWN